jgi:hypothetical protein
MLVIADRRSGFGQPLIGGKIIALKCPGPLTSCSNSSAARIGAARNQRSPLSEASSRNCTAEARNSSAVRITTPN